MPRLPESALESHVAAVLRLGNQAERFHSHRRRIIKSPLARISMDNLADQINRPILLRQAWEHQAAGRFSEAEAIYRGILRTSPDDAEAIHSLGVLRFQQGNPAEALQLIRRSIELAPGIAKFYMHLGNALRGCRDFAGAAEAYEQSLSLEANPLVHMNLASLMWKLDNPDAAREQLERTIQLDPNYAAAHYHLGNVLANVWQLDEALSCFRRALEIDPTMARAHRNLLFSMLRHPKLGPNEILAAHLEWNRRWADPLAREKQSPQNDAAPSRRLKIGYVSGEFYGHLIGRTVLPLLREHDHSQYEVFCYANTSVSDGISQKLQSYADHWRTIEGAGDEQAAQTVRNDGIDILVDLNLHAGEGRLLLFARKPAPIQVTWAGYPGTTGLSTIDYRLSDPYLDPAGEHDEHYSERTVRLPHTFLCYDPSSMEVENEQPAPLPAPANGYVTFGCLNKFSKMNDTVLSLWAKVLARVPNSQLVLLAAPGSHRQMVIDKFSARGIAASRIQFVPQQSHAEYLRTYHRIDIALDTLPYNGHFTSLDALWMGVPVITLVGRTVVGRMAMCVLNNLGLQDELAAWNDEQFVEIAAGLAQNLPRLAELRPSLRQRMLASPLCDAGRFARDVESAFRQMWQTWCESQQ